MVIEKENAALSLASEIKVLIEASRQNPPIGLILCTGEKAEHVELMQLDQSNIRVADYLTVLPLTKFCSRNYTKPLKMPGTNYLTMMLKSRKIDVIPEEFAIVLLSFLFLFGFHY